MKNLLSILCILFCCSSVTAQKNFQKGQLVSDDGTVLSGWIDYRNWDRNPDHIDFKKDSFSSETTRFGTKDLQSFVITGKDAYKRSIVSKDMRSVKASALEVNNEDINIIDTALLRVLIKSDKLSLYELVDAKRHYFISNNNGNVQELQYKVYRGEGGTQMITREIYKDQLKAFALGRDGVDKLMKKIDRASYKSDELTSIVSMLNGDQVNPEFTASRERFKSQVIVSAGAIYSNIKFKGYENLNNVSFAGTISPSITIGVDIFSARRLQANLLRFEISFRKTNYSGKGYREYNAAGFKEDVNYDISQNTLAPGFNYLHKFLNRDKLSVYAGVGGSYNLSTYPENKYTTYNPLSDRTTEQTDYMPLQKAWITGRILTGVIINKKIEVGAHINLIGGFGNTSTHTLKYSAYGLNVGYRF